MQPVAIEASKVATSAPVPNLLDRLQAILGLDDNKLSAQCGELSSELLTLGESVLETWLVAQGKSVENREVEGFRLLGLHRQGAKGDPSFNACRETCRELVYRVNCAQAADEAMDRARQLRLAAMVARHLLLFID